MPGTMRPGDAESTPASRDLWQLLRGWRSDHGEPGIRKMAAVAGLSPGYVSEIFRGLKVPAPDVAADLVQAIRPDQPTQALARRLAEQAAGQRSAAGRSGRPPNPPTVREPEPRPWMTPPIDETLVDRPELAQLIDMLVDHDGARPVAVTAAVHGAGGFGKTTLAAQMGRRPEIARAFPGGLLWVTVGLDPSVQTLAGKINDLSARIGGQGTGPSDLEQAGFRLGELLDRRERTLLVVDDVWSAVHLRPFLVGGSACTRLVTTRVSRALPAETRCVLIDRMNHAQSTQLLRRGVVELPQPVTDRLLRAAGGWALLLSLINRALLIDVRGGADPTRAAEQLADDLEAHGPDILDLNDLGTRDQAVNATLRASLDRLTPGERMRYLEIGIFGEDIDIAFEVTALLWSRTGGLSTRASRLLVQRLRDLALVNSAGVAGIRIHDVLRAYLRRMLGTSRLAANHRHLVEAARALVREVHEECESDCRTPWWSLPADQSYLWQHLSEHLHASGLTGELAALVTDLRWVQQKLQRSGPGSVEADLVLAQTEQATVLRRVIAQQAHLLRPTDPAHALSHVLVSRLDGIDEIQPLVDAYAATLTGPGLRNRWPVPDKASAALMRTLVGHTGDVYALAASPHGDWLASASSDHTVRIWDIQSGQCRTVFDCQRMMGLLVTAPDAQWVAAASHWGTAVDVFDVRSETRKAVLMGHSYRRFKNGSPGGISALVASPDGRWLASAAADGTIRIWETGSWTCSFVLTGHGGTVTALAAGPDGSWLVSGGTDGTVRQWDVASGQCRSVWTDHATEASLSSGVLALVASPDGRWIASGPDFGTGPVNLWHVPSGDRSAAADTASELRITRVMGLASPDARWLAAVYSDAFSIWDMRSAPPRVIVDRIGWPDAMGVAASPDGSWLAVAPGGGGPLLLWDVERCAPRAILEDHVVDGSTVSAPMAAAPDGSWLASAGGRGGSVRIWDTRRRRPEVDPQGVHPASRDVTVMVLSSDGQWLASASGGAVHVRSVPSGRSLATIDYRPKSIHTAVASPDGRWLATADVATSFSRTGFSTGGENAEVRIWETRSWTQQAVLRGHTGAVNVLAASPDGRWLATACGGSDDRTVRLWDSESWTCVARLDDGQRIGDRYTGAATLAMCPEQRWLACAAHDGTLRIWDWNSWACRTLLDSCADRQGSGAHVLAVAPDGRWLASGRCEREPLVRVWDTRSWTLLAALPSHTGDVRAVAVSPDGSWIASGSSHDKAVWIWDARTWTCTAMLPVRLGGFGEGNSAVLAPSPDGRRLATLTDRTVIVWDPVQGSRQALMRVDGNLNGCHWLTSGRQLAVAGTAGLYLFDVR